MDQKYIDEFFDTGRLRISSFKQFSEHTDEQRKDPKEGVSVLTGTSESHTIIAGIRYGSCSYILCGSTREDAQIATDFGCDGCFRINNTTEFGARIANRLSGFQSGLEGFCIYKGERVIRRNIEFSMSDLKENPGDEHDSINKMFDVTRKISGPDPLFLKLNSYCNQNEYRFIWNVTDATYQPLIVECPEARQFCEKVTMEKGLVSLPDFTVGSQVHPNL